MTMLNGAKELLATGFEKSVSSQQLLAKSNVDRLRRVHPDKSPKELINDLGKWYLSTVTVMGASMGVALAAPGADAAVSIPVALADIMALAEASALYVLSVAEVHDLHLEDIERRTLLVATVMLGDSAAGALLTGVGRTAPHWGRKVVKAIPMETINKANKVLGPRFVTKYGAKQGVLVLGNQVPVAIGGVLGGGASHLVGRGIVASARTIFGEPPATWPREPSGPREADDTAGSREDVAGQGLRSRPVDVREPGSKNGAQSI